MTPTPLPPDPLGAAVSDLDSIDSVPPDGQAEVFERVHRLLTQALASTSQADGATAEARP